MTMTFRFRAVAATGAVETGIVDATDRADAVTRLRARRLLPLSVTAATMQRPKSRVATSDIAAGLRTLATLLESGLPMTRALSAFSDVAPRAWQREVPALQARIREGETLASAFESSSLALSEPLIAIVRAGERGGGLANAVNRAANLAEASERLRAAVRNALAYPAVLAFVGTVSLGVIVAVILPRFAEIIGEVGAATPPLTRFVLGAGEAVSAATLPMLVCGVCGAVAWQRLLKTPARRAAWHRVLLNTPFLKHIRLAGASSRACVTLAHLVATGVAIAPALRDAAHSSGDEAVQERILEARNDVIGGTRLSAALRQRVALSAAAVRLISVGEEAGELARMLERAAALDEYFVQTRLQAAVRIIEPAFILVFGAVVAIVATALLQALYAVRP